MQNNTENKASRLTKKVYKEISTRLAEVKKSARSFLGALGSEQDKIILGIVALCFLCSGLAAYLPITASLSEGTRTILLTLIISAGAALLFPRKQNEESQSHE